MMRLPRVIQEQWRVVLVYSLVSLVLLWPLLAPGFILTLDMVFTPQLAMPGTVTSSYLFKAGLHALSLVLPGDLIQKAVLFAILTLSGIGMHRLTCQLQPEGTSVWVVSWAAYASGLLYTVNPFTYSRFMAGQYSVLLGYALIPFFVVALLRFLSGPSTKKALFVLLPTLLISIVSIHTLGLIAIISVIATIQTLWRARADTGLLKKLAFYSVAFGVAFMLASSYWLVPLLQGSGTTAASLTTFRSTDQSAFATAGDGLGGKLMHVVRLQGFWAEGNDLYLLPQDVFGVWGIAMAVVWILVIIGAVRMWRQKRANGILFIGLIVVAALLATGIGSSWLIDYLPFFAGYREPQKFVALVALGYAVCVGFALPYLLTKFRHNGQRIALASGLLLSLVGLTPVMFGGFAGQLTPRHYPADWYTINNQLNRDNGSYQVLLLPWHLYMHYDFAGRIIASPADGFFIKPMIISDNPEIGTVGPAVADHRKQLLTNIILPQAANGTTLGTQLAPLHIRYVLLAKEDDYQKYAYLNAQTDIQLVTETATLKLYRVTTTGKAQP